MQANINGITTQTAAWRRTCWSLFWLAKGKWPTHDDMGVEYTAATHPADFARANTDLAEGWFAVLWILRGDLEYYHDTLCLNAHNALKPCFLCDANTDDRGRPWSDFSVRAAWLPTIWSNAAWLLAHPQHHIVFDLDGVGINTACPDLMHCKHAGTDSYVLGSILRWLTHHKMTGTPDANMKRLWPLIKIGYTATKTTSSGQFTNLKLSMFEPRSSQDAT